MAHPSFPDIPNGMGRPRRISSPGVVRVDEGPAHDWVREDLEVLLAHYELFDE